MERRSPAKTLNRDELARKHQQQRKQALTSMNRMEGIGFDSVSCMARRGQDGRGGSKLRNEVMFDDGEDAKIIRERRHGLLNRLDSPL